MSGSDSERGLQMVSNGGDRKAQEHTQLNFRIYKTLTVISPLRLAMASCFAFGPALKKQKSHSQSWHYIN